LNEDVDRGASGRLAHNAEAGRHAWLATIRISHALAMFVINETDAAAICTTYEQRAEFSAAVELRQLFPGISDNAQARECVRTIVSWRPLPKRLPLMRLRSDTNS
jgi:hypothetical protein